MKKLKVTFLWSLIESRLKNKRPTKEEKLIMLAEDMVNELTISKFDGFKLSACDLATVTNAFKAKMVEEITASAAYHDNMFRSSLEALKTLQGNTQPVRLTDKYPHTYEPLSEVEKTYN